MEALASNKAPEPCWPFRVRELAGLLEPEAPRNLETRTKFAQVKCIKPRVSAGGLSGRPLHSWDSCRPAGHLLLLVLLQAELLFIILLGIARQKVNIIPGTCSSEWLLLFAGVEQVAVPSIGLLPSKRLAPRIIGQLDRASPSGGI